MNVTRKEARLASKINKQQMRDRTDPDHLFAYAEGSSGSSIYLGKILSNRSRTDDLYRATPEGIAIENKAYLEATTTVAFDELPEFSHEALIEEGLAYLAYLRAEELERAYCPYNSSNTETDRVNIDPRLP